MNSEAPARPNLNQIIGSRLGQDASETVTRLSHDQGELLAAVVGRQQRSLTSLTIANNNLANLEHDMSRASDDHLQTSSAIAARLLGSTTTASSPTTTASTTITSNTIAHNQVDIGTSDSNNNDAFSLRIQVELYKHLEQVRDLIVIYSMEVAIILVILIYLVYYFSKISRRPKLIGNKDSDFVASIRTSFKQTLQCRFSPLMYFWGTNPQTALFGYLQGQTSNDEVPRSKFHRQYLYVSDAQYLASNIDLSEHYEKCTRKRHFNHRLCQLNNVQILEEELIQEEDEDEHQQQQQQQDQQDSGRRQLSSNIRFVMDRQLSRVAASPAKAPAEVTVSSKPDRRIDGSQKYHSEGEDEDQVRKAVGGGSGCGQNVTMLTRTSSADSSAIGSSSDSGVFANGESSSSSSSGSQSSALSSSSSSSSSGSSLTIDMVSTPRSGQSKSSRSPSNKCACNPLYAIQHQLQSGYQIIVGETNKQQFKREHFEFGQCALDWYLDSHDNYHKSKSVALISAGMTTGSDKKYVTDTVQTLHKLGYEVCVFIRRGVGGLKLNSTKFFSPSKWHDFEAAILTIKKQRPDCRLVAIGFSFGSIELCRYLSMSGKRSLVASALLISCPFDPEAGGRNMRKRALNRKIDAYLAKNLGKQLYQALSFDESTSDSSSCSDQTQVATIESMESGQVGVPTDTNNNKSTSMMGHSDGMRTSPMSTGRVVNQQDRVYANYNGSSVDLSSLPKIKSLVDFEDNYNRVIQHYPNSDAYGADSRLNELLGQIKTPTLCLSSEDDFMAPFKLLPIKQIEANENLCMILTKRGGHMAFIDGLLWPRRPYFAQRIIEEYMKLAPEANEQQ